MLAWLPCRMICPTCGHRTRIATAWWTHCGLPAVTAGSPPGSLTARLERALSARTLGELAELTADLPSAPAARDVLVVEQHGGKYVKEGRWLVPARVALRTRECRVTLDFTGAVITSRALRIDADMVHGKLFIVSSPGIVINTDGLTCTYSKLKLKLHSTDEAADSRLRIEFAGTLLHAKIIEQRPRR